VEQGSAAIGEAMRRLQAEGYRFAVIDAITGAHFTAEQVAELNRRLAN